MADALCRDHDPQGPCGPTAFWKISDREDKGDDKAQVLLEDLFPLSRFMLIFLIFIGTTLTYLDVCSS